MGEFTLDTTEVGSPEAKLAIGFDITPYLVVAALLIFVVGVFKGWFGK